MVLLALLKLYHKRYCFEAFPLQIKLMVIIFPHCFLNTALDTNILSVSIMCCIKSVGNSVIFASIYNVSLVFITMLQPLVGLEIVYLQMCKRVTKNGEN